jgi:hypothetical protein
MATRYHHAAMEITTLRRKLLAYIRHSIFGIRIRRGLARVKNHPRSGARLETKSRLPAPSFRLSLRAAQRPEQGAALPSASPNRNKDLA